MSAQYDSEVQAVLFGYAHVYQHEGGKWVAELLPEMLNPLVQQKLPPGQLVQVGCDGLVSDCDEDMKMVLVGGEWIALHDAEKWASVPHFLSFESAQKMIMWWLNKERPDLIEASQAFVRDGRIYRAGQAKRHFHSEPLKPEQQKPGAMWGQLLS